VENHAIPTRFSRCEVSKLLHHSTFGEKGICPQITQMDADEDVSFSVSASICVNLRAIPDSVAAGRAVKSVVQILWFQLAALRSLPDLPVSEGAGVPGQ